MKNVCKIITLLALSVMLAIPVVSQATDKKAKSEVVMKMGDKVRLFHSGNVEAQKEIAAKCQDIGYPILTVKYVRTSVTRPMVMYNIS
jgi:hypothetical protein